MILFQNDWNDYPTAIVHESTKNTSWLRMAQLYKRMGIKNHLFPLALVDSELQYINPHDPDISAELAKRVSHECFINPWYYFREVQRIPAKASANPWMYSANRGGIAVIWLALNNVDVGNTQIRQTGKTLTCNSILSYCLNVRCRNTEMQFMTRSSKLLASNINTIKEMRKLLPPYISLISKKDSDNIETVTNSTFKNKIITSVPQGSEEDARSSGRGFVSPIIMIDEPAFCKNIHASYPAMMASSNAASGEARRTGNPTFKLFPCTAGDRGSKSGAFMYDIYHSVARFREVMFDCYNQEELYEMVKVNSRKRRLMVYVEMNHRQLGKSDAWLYEKIGEAAGTPDEMNMDFFNQWSNGSGSSPFDRHVREGIFKSKTEPKWVEVSDRQYMIQWYITKEDIERRIREDVKFIAGMDSSEGIGNDCMTAVIIDEQTLETIGVVNVSEVTNTIHFANFIYKMMVKYTNIVLIPERRSTGIVIIDYLLIKLPEAGFDPFKRIFNRAIHEEMGSNGEIRELMRTPVLKRPVRAHEKFKVLFGYTTSSSGQYSRMNLYDLTLRRMSNYATDKVRDSALVSELMSLEKNDKGRIDHPKGSHDDTVIAWLLAGWLLNFGKNLSHYGILNPLLRCETYHDREKDKKVTVQDRYYSKEQELYKKKLASLIETLSNTDSNLAATLLEKKIRQIAEKISYADKLPKTIDEMLKDASDARRSRILTKNRRVG